MKPNNFNHTNDQQPNLSNQSNVSLSKVPLILTILGFVCTLPCLIYGGVKEAIRGVAGDGFSVAQQSLSSYGIQVSDFGVFDSDLFYYLSIGLCIATIYCVVVAKKDPKLYGKVLIGLSIALYFLLSKVLFFKLLACVLFAISGWQLIKEAQKVNLHQQGFDSKLNTEFS